MRALLFCALVGCTINGGGPTPVTARPPPDPDRMPSDVLDKQDPAADTSKNPVLSRSEAHYVDPDRPAARFAQMLSCGMVRCSTAGGADGSALVIVVAALVVTRRRRPSRRRNRS